MQYQPAGARPGADQQEDPTTSLLGVLKDIGETGLGAVATVGNFLDLPGSSVRDVLAGENPFDQWLTPLSGENRVSGRDLLTQFGVQQNRTGGISDWGSDPMEAVRDIAGFGVEVLTDPFGPALKPLGAAAAVSGAGRGISTVAKKLANVNSMTRNLAAGATGAGRVARALFDPDVLGMVSAAGQKMGIRLSRKNRMREDALRQEATVALMEIDKHLPMVVDDLVDPTDWKNPRSQKNVARNRRAIRDALEPPAEGYERPPYEPLSNDVVEVNGLDGPQVIASVDPVRTVGPDGAEKIDFQVYLVNQGRKPYAMDDVRFIWDQRVEIPKEIESIISFFRTQADGRVRRAIQAGLRTGILRDVREHAYRQGSDAFKRLLEEQDASRRYYRPRPYQEIRATAEGRQEMYQGFLDGTNGIDRFSNDPLWGDIFMQSDEIPGQFVKNVEGADFLVFPDLVVPSHLDNLAAQVGMTGRELWDTVGLGSLMEHLPPKAAGAAPWTPNAGRVKAALKQFFDEYKAQATGEDMIHPAVPRGAMYTRVGTDIPVRLNVARDGSGSQIKVPDGSVDGSRLPVSSTGQPFQVLTPEILESMRNRLPFEEYSKLKEAVDPTSGLPGRPVFYGMHQATPDAPLKEVFLQPHKKLDIEREWSKKFADFDRLVKDEPATRWDIFTTAAYHITRDKYGDRILQYMPVADKNGRIHGTGPNGYQFSFTKSEAIKAADELSDIVDSMTGGGDMSPRRIHLALLGMDDESIDALAIRGPVTRARKVLDKYRTQPIETGTYTVARADRWEQLAEDLAEHATKRESEMFGNNPIVDYFDQSFHQEKAIHWLDEVIEMAVDSAKHLKGFPLSGDVAHVVGDLPSGRRFSEMLDKGDLGKAVNTRVLMDRIGNRLIDEGLFPRPKNPLSGYGVVDQTMLDYINHLRISEKLMEELALVHLSTDSLPEVGLLARVAQNLNIWFKSLTLGAPATVVRDVASASLQMFVTGGINPTLKFMNKLNSARQIAMGKVGAVGDIPEVTQMLRRLGIPDTPVTRSQAFASMYAADFKGGPIHSAVDRADELAMETSGQAERFLNSVPNQQGRSVVERGRRYLQKTPLSTRINPLAQRGVWQREGNRWVQRSDAWAVSESLNAVKDTGDNTVRMAMMLEYMENGKRMPNGRVRKLSWAEAKAEVDRVQVSYDPRSQTRFERQYLKPWIPFYTFVSRSVPMFAMELLRNPGGRLGQVVRAQRLAQGDEDDYVPWGIRDSAAIPWGEKEDGTLQYITKLGLMHEDALRYISDGLQGDSRGMLQKIIGSMNPVAKWAVEQATNTSLFFQGPMGGRRLDDLDPTLGRIAADLNLREVGPSGRPLPVGSSTFESLVSASPVSRPLSIMRNLTSERKSAMEKALQFMTGVQFTEVSPQATVRELRDRINKAQIEAGASPLTTVIGADKVRKRLVEMGDLEKAAQLERLDNALRRLRKIMKEEDKEDVRAGR